MITEWMKVMLEEVSRKKAEAEQARAEEQTRAEEQARADEQTRAEEQARADERRRVVIESTTCAREKKIGDAE
jgi:hypothetical protein